MRKRCMGRRGGGMWRLREAAGTRNRVAGKNVTLTLDKDLQAAAQDALQAFLDGHPNASGGAVVALDVEDGGVLAMASLPGYDPETFSKQYGALAQDEGHPLMNRAIQGLYAPGSTFKLVTATAALEEGVLTPETKILDTGRYTYYKSPQPQCWLYRQAGKTHGLETVTDAIADSCNIFFFDAGRRVGVETLGAYAKALGLGEKTGIELAGEQAGVVAGRRIRRPWVGRGMREACCLRPSGRRTIASRRCSWLHMTATLVSGGERRQVHLLKQVAGEEAQEAVSLGKIALSEKNLTAIKEGMRRVVRSGSLAEAFRDLPVTAGAKTGSAQVAGEEESNAVLVCFAPYDVPKIALALVAEQGGSGAALGDAAAGHSEYLGSGKSVLRKRTFVRGLCALPRERFLGNRRKSCEISTKERKVPQKNHLFERFERREIPGRGFSSGPIYAMITKL